MADLTSLMTAMAGATEVGADNANHRRIVYEVASMSRLWAAESAKQAMRGPEKKAGHEALREQSEEYQRIAAAYGVLPPLEQRISAEQMAKLRERVAFSGTADTSVM